MDYAKFLTMWLHKGKYKNIQVLSQETIDLAQRTTVEQPQGAPHSHQSLAWMMLKPDATSSKINYFMHGGADGTQAFVYPQEQTIALYFTQSRDHERFIFANLMAITEPYNVYRKWTYNNEYLDQWKEILLQDKEARIIEPIDQYESFLGKYKCITNGAFDSEIIRKNGQLIIKNLQSKNECKLNQYRDNEFICRFRPPPDGFISKVLFKVNDDNKHSFSLEWLNKRKFEFEKQE
jgi:CubicO group peptidase (beta-lactamase class C family)